MKFLIFAAALVTSITTTYAQTYNQRLNDLELEQQRRRTEEMTTQFFNSQQQRPKANHTKRGDGAWCISQPIYSGQGDTVTCVFTSKQDCISKNAYRAASKSRCISNPDFNDQDE